MNEQARVEEVKNRYADSLLAQPGVAGVGIERTEEGELYLAVHVEGSIKELALPDAIDGVPIVLVPSGPFRG